MTVGDAILVYATGGWICWWGLHCLLVHLTDRDNNGTSLEMSPIHEFTALTLSAVVWPAIVYMLTMGLIYRVVEHRQ
jgi:hypothetical protein